MILNHHGGSRYAPQGSVDHRVNPPKDAEEEEKPSLSRLARHLDPHEMDRAIVGLCEDLEHERDRRYALTDFVRKHLKDLEADRAKDRADYATAQLQVERDVRSLVDELVYPARKSLNRVERSLIYASRRIVWSASART